MKIDEKNDVIKLTVVGNVTVGKTSMLISYLKNEKTFEWVPNVMDNYIKKVEFKNKKFDLSLFDSFGGEDYDQLRPLSYPYTNIFLVCFSLIDQWSFDNTKTIWIPEITKHVYF
jgi:small GTP-binding protein